MELVKRANMNTKKNTGLSSFTNKGKVTTKEDAVTITQDMVTTKEPSTTRKRGKGDVVALTVRLTRSDWERVHHLAISEGVSIQRLTVDGLSKVFKKHGLPELES